MENFLNRRLEALEKVLKEALENKNYTFALNIHIRIDEIKDLIYLLKNEIDISATNSYDQKGA